jgi:hypothetical protein
MVAVAILLTVPSAAQEKVKLDDAFQFSDGVFLTFADFLNNDAVDPSKVTSVHSARLVRDFDLSDIQKARGLSWDFFAELIFSATSSITLDSITLEMEDNGFELLIPGHNFFGLKINDRLYINISPHKRPSNFGQPVFGRVAFTGQLMVLYVDYNYDNDSYYYVSDNDGNVVREGGMQESIRSIVIFDVPNNNFEFADERSFLKRIEDDEIVREKYLADKKRKKRIPYYADLYNQRNPVYLP